jgi:hypothetical protein
MFKCSASPYLFSANGASSFQLAAARIVIRLSTPNAFGGFNAPDIPRRISCCPTTAMNRAFSADGSEVPDNPRALPQATDEGAPSALNRYLTHLSSPSTDLLADAVEGNAFARIKFGGGFVETCKQCGLLRF